MTSLPPDKIDEACRAKAPLCGAVTDQSRDVSDMVD